VQLKNRELTIPPVLEYCLN